MNKLQNTLQLRSFVRVSTIFKLYNMEENCLMLRLYIVNKM